MRHHREDLIQRLDHILRELDRGSDHFLGELGQGPYHVLGELGQRPDRGLFMMRLEQLRMIGELGSLRRRTTRLLNHQWIRRREERYGKLKQVLLEVEREAAMNTVALPRTSPKLACSSSKLTPVDVAQDTTRLLLCPSRVRDFAGNTLS